MKGIKSFLAMLMASVFIFGCATGLTNLKPTDDIDKVMAQVHKLTPDKDGWQILEILDKNFKENGIRYHAFIRGDISGVAVVWSVGDIQWLAYEEGQWYFVGRPIAEEKAQELLRVWIEMVCKNGDLANAHQFDPATMLSLPQGTDI